MPNPHPLHVNREKGSWKYGNPGGTKKTPKDFSLTKLIKQRMLQQAPQEFVDAVLPKDEEGKPIKPRGFKRQRRQVYRVFIDALLKAGIIDNKVTALTEIWQMIDSRPAQKIEGTDVPIQLIIRGAKIP